MAFMHNPGHAVPNNTGREWVADCFDRLFDDAAIFPPGNAPMSVAVAAHRRWRASRQTGFVGPFVCSVTRIDELRGVLGTDAESLDIALVCPADVYPDAVHDVLADNRMRLTAVELSPHDVLAPSVDMDDVMLYYELPWHSQADLPPGTGRKFRTGGPGPDHFPRAEELARAVAFCVEQAEPFKLTAGLHHAIRHRDPQTGFEHHGFLNVLAAVDAAQDGAGPDVLAQILDSQDADSIAGRVASIDDPSRVRSVFRSFGTCSIQEPLTDLEQLALVEAM